MTVFDYTLVSARLCVIKHFFACAYSYSRERIYCRRTGQIHVSVRSGTVGDNFVRVVRVFLLGNIERFPMQAVVHGGYIFACE